MSFRNSQVTPSELYGPPTIYKRPQQQSAIFFEGGMQRTKLKKPLRHNNFHGGRTRSRTCFARQARGKIRRPGTGIFCSIEDASVSMLTVSDSSGARFAAVL